MARNQMSLAKAREIRKWWTENVQRFHNGEIGNRDLRREIAKVYGVHEDTIANILARKTYKEPSA